MKWLFVTVALSVSTALPVLPDESLVQTQASKTLGTFEPHKSYNYTCDQCNRMIYSLKGFCQGTSGESLGQSDAVIRRCADDTAAVSFADGSRVKGKCAAFYQFVRELYCPLDPCTQVAIQSHRAHNAICGLMRCAGAETPLEVVPRDMPWIPDTLPPLTCGEYLTTALGVCKLDQTKNASEVCQGYGHTFQKLGCEIVVERMQATVAPLNMCQAWTCDDPGKTPITPTKNTCSDVLRLPEHEIVVVPEYMYWRSQTDSAVAGEAPAPIRMESLGIVITRATLGYGEHCNMDHTNNVLHRSQMQCQHLRYCDWSNPNLVGRGVLEDREPLCEGNFAIEYTCVPGGKKHAVYATHASTYATVPLDCIKEVDAVNPFPKPSKDQPSLNPAEWVMNDIYKGTLRKENSFQTPALQAEFDASLKRSDEVL